MNLLECWFINNFYYGCICSGGIISEIHRTNPAGKLPTFNQPWTVTEQVSINDVIIMFINIVIFIMADIKVESSA